LSVPNSVSHEPFLQWGIHTFPAESNPNISIRTSWSLLHRTKDDKELNNDDIESPIVVQMFSGGRGRTSVEWDGRLVKQYDHHVET